MCIRDSPITGCKSNARSSRRNWKTVPMASGLPGSWTRSGRDILVTNHPTDYATQALTRREYSSSAGLIGLRPSGSLEPPIVPARWLLVAGVFHTRHSAGSAYQPWRTGIRWTGWCILRLPRLHQEHNDSASGLSGSGIFFFFRPLEDVLHNIVQAF